MQRIRSVLLILLIGVWFGSIHACMGDLDPVSAGVLFNSNERVDLTRFARLGTDGKSYFEQCPDQTAEVAKPVIMLTPDIRVPMYHDPARIRSVTIVDTRLYLEVTYSGGCAAHTFDLYAETALMESLPPIASVYLSHDANGDVCESIATETLVFDISPFDDYYTPDAPVWLNLVAPQHSDTTVGDTVLRDLLWYPRMGCAVKYRSHAFSDAMVYLGFYAPGPQREQLFPRIVFVMDPDIVFVAPFDFGAAVDAELDWLQQQGVVTGVAASDREAIPEAVRGGNAQYWTLQDSARAYNAYFTYAKDQQGYWQWGDVQAVRGCGTGVTFELPESPLATVSQRFTTGRPSARPAEARWRARATRTHVLVGFEEPVRRSGHVRVIDLHGRELSSGPAVQGATSVALPRRHIGFTGWCVVELHMQGEATVRQGIMLRP